MSTVYVIFIQNSLSEFELKSVSFTQTPTLERTNAQRDQFLQYSHYIRVKPELDSLLVSQAADFFKVSSWTLLV